MLYWHVAVLILVLSPQEAVEVRVPYRDAMSCGEALPHLTQAARVDHPDSYAICVATDLPSGVTVRPRARP